MKHAVLHWGFCESVLKIVDLDPEIKKAKLLTIKYLFAIYSHNV